MKRLFVVMALCACGLLVAGGAAAQGEVKDLSSGERTAPPRVFVPTPTGPTVFCSTPNLSIPDDDPVGVTDEIVITDSLTIDDLNVSINTTHTWVGDLHFRLENKDTGTTAPLINRPGLWPNDPDDCCGCSGDDIDCTLDDEASNPVEDECADGVPTIFGDFTAGDPLDGDVDVLSNFDGEDAAATWTLTVSDDAGGDLGTLNEWCLIVEGDGAGCGLSAAMENRNLRPGQVADVDVTVTHNRPSTVTVPFYLWIEDRRGRVITSGTTDPITLNPGDHLTGRYGLQVPAGTRPGVYTLHVTIREMAQGEAETRVTFRVR